MNKLIIATAATATAASLVFGAGLAFAGNYGTAGQGAGNGNGGQQAGRGLDTKAEVLHLTTEQLRAQLQTKTLAEVAKDQNISLDALHQSAQSSAQARWHAAGLSEEQMAERQQAMADRQADCDGTGSGSGQMKRGNR